MGGMLEGAKTKIWGIVNDVLRRQGNAGASIRVGLLPAATAVTPT